MAKKKKRNNKWMRYRHRVVRNILSVTLGTYSKIKYGIKIERFAEQEDRPYLILLNHQTGFDQFFVGMAFKGPVYYLASEDIFSMGFVSSIIRFLVAPIPIKKQTTDVRAILNCIKVAKEGGTIAIAPEGNRTYSGKTTYMSPSIVPLAKKLGLPIALFRIEGGYGVQPRWSDVVRKGKMKAYVSRVIYPEEYSKMDDDALFTLIEDGLFVDESLPDGEFIHKKSAEYLERALYVCPFCGLSTFESNDDKLECKRCQRVFKYTSRKEIVGEGFESPFASVAAWYDYQSEYMNSLDTLADLDKALYDECVDLYEVIPCKNKELIQKGARIRLFGDRIVINTDSEELLFPFESTSAVTVLGKNKLNIYGRDKIYQLKGNKRFNALKYLHVFHRCRNILKGDKNEQFLGL